MYAVQLAGGQAQCNDEGAAEPGRDRGLRDGVTAVRAIGYRQVVQLLDGEITDGEARAAVKKATRRFFRKQLGWYRRDPRITWLDANNPTMGATVLARLGLIPTAEGAVDATIQLP